MRVLLDTSCLFDIMDRPGMFPEAGRRVLESPGTEFFVSAVSIREMRFKFNSRHRSGEHKSRFSPGDVVTVPEDRDMTFLPVTMRHAAGELDIPLDHEDPFDELLMVQAQKEGLRLPTADALLAGHPLAVAAHELG